MIKNRLLTDLPASEFERIRPYLEPVQLELKQHLLHVEEPIPYVWFPDDCVTSTVVNTEEGATIEVGMMGWDGMVGLSLLFFEEVSNTTVFVQVPGHATRMRADAFVQHVRDPGGPLFRQVQRYGNAFMAMVAQTAACNNLHSMDERICRWILITHDRVQRDEFPLTHEFLSAMLGVRRATVSVEANRLQQAGLIKYRHGLMRVTNREGLEDGVCECYEIINKLFARIFNGRLEPTKQDTRR